MTSHLYEGDRCDVCLLITNLQMYMRVVLLYQRGIYLKSEINYTVHVYQLIARSYTWSHYYTYCRNT